jgi:TldD protein
VIEEELCRIKHSVVVYASDGKQSKWNFLFVGGSGGMETIAVDENGLSEMIDMANRLLSAERIKPGFYDVVADPSITGLIAHEAFGHGVETDMYLKNRARSRIYLGKMIASPLVSIIDDPTLPNGHGSYFVDDEGEPARPTYIIRNGRFVRGLTNMYSNLVLGLPRTSNGRRESFEHKVYTRMSNTFFKPGRSNLDEMMSSVRHGVYLVNGISGMEDPKGWGIQVLGHCGKEIKNGRITGRIFSPVGITGYVPDLLKGVSMVGNDFRVDSGTCGKGHKEWIPVSSGGPHIKTRARLG